MERVEDLAIVLRAVKFEERHLIVTAITEHHGKISAMARNAVHSRRFGGVLEPFTAGEWKLIHKPGSELYRLDEATVRRSYEGIRKDFENYALGGVFNELMLRVAPEREPCEELFKLHAHALVAIEEVDSIASTRAFRLSLLNAYLSRILRWAGSLPQLEKCFTCEKSLADLEQGEQVSGLVADAAWICPECRAKTTRHLQIQPIRLDPVSVFAISLALKNPIRNLPQMIAAAGMGEAEQEKLFQFLEAILAFHIPGSDRAPLQGLRFLGIESNLQPQAESPR